MPDALGLLTLFALALTLVVVLCAYGLVRALLYPPRKTYAVALARGLPTHPDGATPLGGSETTLTLADGKETPAFVVNGANAGGPTVVIVHGFGDSRYGALTWATLVVPHARDVIVYDLRGHGESEPARAEIVVGDVRDLRRILEELDAPNGVVLFGYSMGAVVSIGAAAELSERNTASLRDGLGEGDRGEREMNTRAQPRLLGVIADGPYRTWSEPIVRHLRLRRWPAQPTTFLAGLALRAMTRGLGFDRVRDAARLGVPLLVLHGTDDALCPVESGRAIAEAARCPGSELVVFEGGGHLDLAAIGEGRYRDALARFFDRISHGNQASCRPDRPHAAQGGGAAG